MRAWGSQSPSTFGWWAGFLSSKMTTVHFPLLPMKAPLPWCSLMVRFSNLARRFVYHDWYLLITLPVDIIGHARTK